jgi:hypothetical protein
MRAVAAQRLASGTHRSEELCPMYRDRFALATTGTRYRNRLETLWQQRHHLGQQLRWRATPAPPR